jgi:hypothetical protein
LLNQEIGILSVCVIAEGDLYSQIRKEVSFTKGRIIVRGKLMALCDQLESQHINATDALPAGTID